ncbi:MAG: DAK2 domain-containing protein [Rhodobacteraceae bacterium]|nr:DAK2 domain-containing protein [Paracoccaceae bacterium]MCY4197979.1 DAK2 domain-containing protein [Paracoccaceae bacterium]MCY4326351.1 DAK2 domain-containing protein [Paracoccaceae bacterium]
MSFRVDDLVAAAERIAKAAREAKDELNAQDGRLGDGDLGITLDKGWAEATALEVDDPDLGRYFLALSKAFQRVSSSSFGTLLATGLMAAAKGTKGRNAVEYHEVTDLIAAARDAMMARGKGELGQKSVLDILDALAIATRDLNDPGDIAEAARQAVEVSLETFRNQPAGLGRARMYGEASIGLDDPGMLATRHMVNGLISDNSAP